MRKYPASVIIPTYNRLTELKMTLDSLLKQNSKHPFEVIVADDGSAVNTKGIVDMYIGELNIRYCFQEDKGFRAAAARNMGIKLSDGEICIFVDNGIILHSKAIEYHIEAHLHEKEPCVVLGYVYGFEIKEEEIEELKDVILKNNPDDAIGILEAKKLFDIREIYYQELGDDLSRWPAPFAICWTCNLSVPKDILIKVGMFDEYFTTWGNEDDDLGLSLLENNVKFVLERSASSIHYPHDKVHAWNTENYRIEVERVRIKKEYMLKKHPIRPMELWTKVWRVVDLNKALLEESNWEASHD